MKLEEAVKNIRPLDQTAMDAAWKHWDSIAKPLRSLGKLEETVVKIAGMQRTPQVDVKKKRLIVMCADNGVVAEGISQTGQDVTAVVAENFLDDRTCTALMAKECGAELIPVDIGMVKDTKVDRSDKIAYGTKDFLKEPAMTRDQAVRAVEVGIRRAEQAKNDGCRMLATGEMGIGNTTTSSAVVAALLGVPVETVTGKGAGLSNASLVHKCEVIKEAIAKHHPDPEDPIDVLSKVGGFDIAGMAGVCLGGAALGMPVVIDGFISAASAILAQHICPAVTDYLLASHVSGEPAGQMLIEKLGLDPWLYCNMRLGEGSGAVAMFPILDMAVKVYYSMATFEGINIEAYKPL